MNGVVADEKRSQKHFTSFFPEDWTFDVGVDTRTPIDYNDYQVPFRFTGNPVKLTVELHPISTTIEEILKSNGNSGLN